MTRTILPSLVFAVVVLGCADLIEPNPVQKAAFSAASLCDVKKLEAMVDKDHSVLTVRKGPNGDTLLHFAAAHGCPGAVELLISKGMEVHIRNDNAETALHRAVEHGCRRVAEKLLAHGADVNAVVNSQPRGVGGGWHALMELSGGTPLHYAAFEGSMEMAKLLIDHGADLAAKDYHGQTPADVAETRESHELARYLAECVAGGEAATNTRDNHN